MIAQLAIKTCESLQNDNLMAKRMAIAQLATRLGLIKAVPMWLLQVGVLLRVLRGYSAATTCKVASITVVSSVPSKVLLTCSSNSGTA